MAGATLILGSDEFLVARAVSDAIRAAVASGLTPDAVSELAAVAGGEMGGGGSDGGGVPPMEVAEVAAVETDVNELRELASPSLFGDARTVVLRDMQDADKALVAAVVELVESGDSGPLVLTHAGGAKGKATVDALRAAGASVVTIEAPRSARDREQFVADEVRRFGGSIDRAAIGDLVAAVGNDLRELSTVVAQLVADTGPRVSAEAVATYHRGRAELTGFVVADRAVEGALGPAVESVRWALEGGVEPVLISAALAANLRLIGQVAGRRGSPDALASVLKQPAWKIRRAQGWVRRWRPEALATAVAAVAAADADVKGGGEDAAYAVERAVITVAAASAG